MAKEKNLAELADSYQFQCRGKAKAAGLSVFHRKEAVPVIVKIYKDGKSEAECTSLSGDSCDAACDGENYGKRPYVTKARRNQK